MTIASELLQFISTQVTLCEVAADEPLISTGKVDSMGLLQILSHIDETYGVSLLSDGTPTDFETVNAFAAAVERARQSSAAK